jgi:hypothetical protein
MKLRKKISLILIALITCSILFAWISPIKLVKVNHEAFFTKDFYYYMIEIYDQDQLYFKNANKNEISLTKVTPANVANGSEYFLTFKDSVEVFVRTDYVDTTRTIPLDRFTIMYIHPTQNVSFIHASTDTIPFWD